MATMVDTALSTSSESFPSTVSHRKNGTPVPSAVDTSLKNQNGIVSSNTSSPKRLVKRYNHVFAIHHKEKASPLSQDAAETPSFFGFKNLMALMLIVSNLRLMIENFRKYGVLVCMSCFQFRRQDLVYGSITYLSVPVHLLFAYLIELLAARHTKSVLANLKKEQAQGMSEKQVRKQSEKDFQLVWYAVAVAHSVNAALNLILSTVVVWRDIYHPGIGTLVELHAVIVCMKVCSYALTNRDLRHALLWPDANDSIPDLYDQCPYPQNITLKNLCYFWWAPTLVYQPVYPRTTRIRRTFVIKRLGELVGLAIIIWIMSAQYAAPLLQNSLDKMASLDIVSILERLMKLSTISLFCWLCGFYALFHSFLNLLAEIMRFADREFYSDWWNVSSVRTYWTSWNKPVYYFMRRHIYAPMVGRGVSPTIAQIGVFLFSGFLHELLVGVPTHNVIWVAFAGMLLQIPLILMTDMFRGPNVGYHARVAGNCMFWISFCLVGQPLAAMLYFFAWQAKYGTIMKR